VNGFQASIRRQTGEQPVTVERACAAIAVFFVFAFAPAGVRVPKIWHDADVMNWATPIAALNVPPGHFTSDEYYEAPADNLRTYPVYAPDREPPGYWEWLQKQRPEPLVDLSKIRTYPDWIAAGERAFREIDTIAARTADPAAIAQARDPRSFESVYTLPDGSVLDPRWVITERGVMLTTSDCASCHMRLQDDGTLLFAGPMASWPAGIASPRPAAPPITEFFVRTFSTRFPGDSFGLAFWRTTAAPWAPDERVERFPGMSRFEDFLYLFAGQNGTVTRVNGRPFYGTKVPDLHTLRYYRYLDATGTHRLRRPEDVARYIALITGADAMEFGEHRTLTAGQRRVAYRYADETLYAIAVYLLSLEPLRNPNPAPREILDAGLRIFQAQGCANCHTPPTYTNGKLTLAQGYEPPRDHPNRDDIVPASVETDPGLALKTRKGTGFYKTPSLRGLWYRPFLLHDGSVASLEELFNPNRMNPEHARGGWKVPGAETHAVPGHRFGLDLDPEAKAALLAFLRSL
jgi:hypothetical protein